MSDNIFVDKDVFYKLVVHSTKDDGLKEVYFCAEATVNREGVSVHSEKADIFYSDLMDVFLELLKVGRAAGSDKKKAESRDILNASMLRPPRWRIEDEEKKDE